MSLLSQLFGRGEQETGGPASPSPSAVEPAQGWIRVRNGTPELVRQAVNAYTDNFRAVKPKDFRVRVAEHPDGFLAVTFPDGVTPYAFVNLIGWLNQPPAIEEVSEADGWITPPSSGRRYSLQPGSGETLIGRAFYGKAVQVYQPEASMCEISRRVRLLPEPDLSAIPSDSGIAFSVTLDVDPSFGNPEFEITHSKDTDWNG